MKRVVVERYGGPEVLRVVEDDDPQPGPGEVRVNVLAAGVSFTDALLRAGTYLGVPKPPFTPGYELVGIVEELGPGCSRLRKGDRIASLTVNEDFLARVRELAGDGVDVALDGIGGAVSVRSFRALRPGGRLVVFGHYSTLANGRKSWRGWIEWYTATATVALWSLVPPRRRVLAYRIQKLRKGHQVLPMSVGRALLAVEVRVTQIGSGRTSSLCWSCSVQARSIRLSRSACRCPTLVARTNGSRARRRRESWCSYPDRTKVLSDGGCERRCGLGGQFLKTDRSSHRRSLCLFFTGGIVGYS